MRLIKNQDKPVTSHLRSSRVVGKHLCRSIKALKAYTSDPVTQFYVYRNTYFFKTSSTNTILDPILYTQLRVSQGGPEWQLAHVVPAIACQVQVTSAEVAIGSC